MRGENVEYVNLKYLIFCEDFPFGLTITMSIKLGALKDCNSESNIRSCTIE